MTEKRPATGSRGMVVTNHPLASAAGAEMLAAGGNAIDAAIAALFTLTVVEPMMVGVLGGGMAHIRLADGTHHVIDGQSTRAARHRPHHLHARSECRARNDGHDRPQERGRPDCGRRARQPDGLVRGAGVASAPSPLADVTEPAIRHASRGFRVTPYLHECVSDCAADMARDPEIARLYLPDGAPITAGHAAGHRRLCRDAAHHREGGPGRAVRRRARPALRRPHGASRRLHHAG